MLRTDETQEVAPPSTKPCAVCGKPALSDTLLLLGSWLLCRRHMARWFTDGRFGGDMEANRAAMPQWVADEKSEVAP